MRETSVVTRRGFKDTNTASTPARCALRRSWGLWAISLRSGSLTRLLGTRGGTPKSGRTTTNLCSGLAGRFQSSWRSRWDWITTLQLCAWGKSHQRPCRTCQHLVSSPEPPRFTWSYPEKSTKYQPTQKPFMASFSRRFCKYEVSLQTRSCNLIIWGTFGRAKSSDRPTHKRPSDFYNDLTN